LIIEQDSKFMLYFFYLLVSMLFHRCHYLELSCSKSFFLKERLFETWLFAIKEIKKRSKKSREGKLGFRQQIRFFHQILDSTAQI
jgi:hypothetical protein